MLFNSAEFLIFFPVVVLLYFVIPKKLRQFWLLAASYYFYMCWNAKYIILIFFSTCITYISGLMLEKVKQKRRKKLVVAASLALNLAILFYFKYINFMLGTLQGIFSLFHVELNLPAFDILLPVGISFYVFQALGYTIDVYWDEIHAERNFWQYALFVSFFPQLVAGPIERSRNLLGQLAEPKKFQFEAAREGLLLMLWGFFMKLMVADRAALFVNTAYGSFQRYTGWYLVVATMLFAVQVYCDFYGYSVIAMGAARILGIELMDNFDAPYFSTSVAELWRRWHISLTTWFRDYLYIPLGGSRKGKARKYFNILVVFLVSGLWHGADLSFVVWGGLNGAGQIIGEVLMPIRDRAVSLLRLHRDSLGHRLLHIAGTLVFFDFSLIFFRADSFADAVEIIRLIIEGRNPEIFFDGSIYWCGLDSKNFWLLLICILILGFADYCKYRGIRIREVIAAQDVWFRWLVIVFAICAIVTLGIWGSKYEAANFIYFQF